MPANINKTDIRLMRGSSVSSENWIPNPGEPLVDMESMTLNFGDGVTSGGIPINTVTCHILEGTQQLNTLVTYGRFFISSFTGGPADVPTDSDLFLTVQASDIKSFQIWQTMQILNGIFVEKIFNRISMDAGKTWSEWKESTGNGFLKTSINDLNKFIDASSFFVNNMINGPDGSNGANGMLEVLVPERESAQIYQLLYICTGTLIGRIYYRFSNTRNSSFSTPGYNWLELTDFVNRNLLNATGILPTKNGGTGRNDGGVGVADAAIRLLNPRTIATSGAGTGSPVPFDGTGNITIPITNLNASSLTTGTVPVARMSGVYNIAITGSAKKADYADLAEYYKSKDKVLPGEPVAVSTTEGYEIEKLNEYNYFWYLGIVSTKPGFVLNAEHENTEGYYPIARIGKTPANVTGTCKSGDMLYLAENGTIVSIGGIKKVGFALETKTTEETESIMILI